MQPDGQIRLEILFHDQLEKPVTMLVINEQQRILNIPQMGRGDVFVQ